MGEGTAPGPALCRGGESRGDVARRPSLGPIRVPRGGHGKVQGAEQTGSYACSQLPACSRAANVAAVAPAEEPGGDARARIRCGGGSGQRRQSQVCWALQGRILHRGWGLRHAHRCPPAPWEQEMALEDQESPGPWCWVGIPWGPSLRSRGGGADRDVGDAVPAAGVAGRCWCPPRTPATGTQQTQRGW